MGGFSRVEWLRLMVKKSGEDFAKKMGTTRQTIDTWEKHVSEDEWNTGKRKEVKWEEVKSCFSEAFPEVAASIEKISAWRFFPLSKIDIKKAGSEHLALKARPEEIEEGALPWAWDFRTRFLLRRLTYLATASGMKTSLLDGIPVPQQNLWGRSGSGSAPSL